MWMIRLTAVWLLSVPLAPAFAHAAHDPVGSALPWRWDPGVLSLLVAAILLYSLGAWRLFRRDRLRVIDASQAGAFWSGILVLFLALESPLDALADRLLSIHMVQHLLLILAAAPLLVWSKPAVVFLWALPRRARKAAGRIWAACGLKPAFHALTQPTFVWIVFSGAFVFWHMPEPFRWGLRSEFAHALEHLSFFVTGLAFWLVVLAPSGRRRLGYGPTILYVATTAVVSGLPGALMLFASRALYSLAATPGFGWGLTPLEDQQLAGLLMWIPMDGFYFAVCGAFFLLWLRDADRRAIAVHSSLLTSSLVLVALGGLLAGCGDQDDATPLVNFSGDAQRGVTLINQYGCGGCHIIPGIANAKGNVGPPLTGIGRRVFIAGMLRNSPANLAEWIQNPQQIVPGNAMPDMNIPEDKARDIATFLSTLK